MDQHRPRPWAIAVMALALPPVAIAMIARRFELAAVGVTALLAARIWGFRPRDESDE